MHTERKREEGEGTIVEEEEGKEERRKHTYRDRFSTQ